MARSGTAIAILARGADPVETRRGLPGDPEDAHSRYIEATVRGILVGCLYLPNGDPAPGPKFDYKLGWFERLVFRPEVRRAFHRLIEQGWADALRTLYPTERIYTFWDYFRNAWARDAGLRIDHLLLSPILAKRLVAAGVDREVRGWDKTSDHAPVWIEIDDVREKRRPTR
jgi:exodeoxyribonuclease-3